MEGTSPASSSPNSAEIQDIYPRAEFSKGFQNPNSFSSIFSFPSLELGLFLLPAKELVRGFPFYLSHVKVNKTCFPTSLPSVKYSAWNLGFFGGGILGRNGSGGVRNFNTACCRCLNRFLRLGCCSESGIWGRSLVLKTPGFGPVSGIPGGKARPGFLLLLVLFWCVWIETSCLEGWDGAEFGDISVDSTAGADVLLG